MVSNVRSEACDATALVLPAVFPQHQATFRASDGTHDFTELIRKDSSALKLAPGVVGHEKFLLVGLARRHVLQSILRPGSSYRIPPFTGHRAELLRTCDKGQFRQPKRPISNRLPRRQTAKAMFTAPPTPERFGSIRPVPGSPLFRPQAAPPVSRKAARCVAREGVRRVHPPQVAVQNSVQRFNNCPRGPELGRVRPDVKRSSTNWRF